MKPLPMSLTPRSDSCCSGPTESCCPSSSTKLTFTAEKWTEDFIATAVGPVARIQTQLASADILGGWKVRWGINRMNYIVSPGIYCTGNPNSDSPVLVTANYKLTFDALRKELNGVNAWIVVLDTKGINVWCAAGKGTFGTSELVQRIQAVSLSSIVTHRTLILPQLSAPGISAHEVFKQSGFKVVYGPIRASDVPIYLKNGMTADERMRIVQFTVWDRTILTPIEVVSTIRPLLMTLGILFIANSFKLGSFGQFDLIALLGAIFAGAVLTPILLPWIPGRAFSLKGWLLGLLWTLLLLAFGHIFSLSFMTVAYILLLPTISAYFAMNFTGSSTYTSFTGVKREMKIAVPLMGASTALGLIVLIVNGVLASIHG